MAAKWGLAFRSEHTRRSFEWGDLTLPIPPSPFFSVSVVGIIVVIFFWEDDPFESSPRDIRGVNVTMGRGEEEEEDKDDADMNIGRLTAAKRGSRDRKLDGEDIDVAGLG